MNTVAPKCWPRRLAIFIVAALSIVASAGALSTSALAQNSAAPNAPQQAELKQLLDTLENEAERKKLTRQLRTLLKAQSAADQEEQPTAVGSRFVAAAARQAKDLADQLTAAAESLRGLPEFYRSFLDEVGDPESRGAWLRLIFKLLLVAVAGYLAFLLIRWLLARPLKSIESKESDSLWVRAPFLLVRTALDFIPVFAFFGIAQAVLPLTEPSDQTQSVIVVLLNAYLIVGITVVIARMLMVPRISGLRVLPLTDTTSNYLFIWVRRFTYVAVYGLFVADAALIMGFSLEGHSALSGFIGLIVLAMAVMFVLQNRQHFAAWMRGDENTEWLFGLQGLRNRFADIWHALAIIYLVAIYAIWLMRIEDGFEFMLRATLLTVLIVLIAQGLTLAIRRLVQRGFSLGDELRSKYPTLEERANRYLPVMQTILRWVVYIVAALAVLSAWGLDVPGWLDRPTGRRFLSGAISIAIVLVVALVVWEGISSAIERYLNRADGESFDRARRARARTLLPLLRNAVMIVIVVMVALVILSELGLNIGPLLAGAGVIGLAVGFGSQRLVQDVITGAFILFEDSMAVGDVVKIAGITATVEALSIRSIRMRDVSGNVHTVPFSAVNEVTNMTKDYSYYLFEIGVGYRESVDDVMDVLAQLGTEIQEDPEFGPMILEPLHIQGVDKFADSAVIIRARFKTQPVQQWAVGREFNRRIKNRFDELGIEIPFPHTTIYFGEDKRGNAPALRWKEAPERGPENPDTDRPSPDERTQARRNAAPSDSGQDGAGDE